MKLVSTPRIDFLRTLAGEILHNYGRGRTIISIDGTEGAGRAAFADDLAAVLREDERHVFRASLRYFQYSRAERQRIASELSAADDPDLLYRIGYDYSALRRVLVEPFRMGGSTGFVTEEFDPDRDSWIQPTWQTAPEDAILIIDGDYINRPELRSLWLFSVLLEGQPATDSHSRYLAEVHPRDIVSAVVDLTNQQAPWRVLNDSC
jgi:uridine kinase